jgi:hypothetical protein
MKRPTLLLWEHEDRLATVLRPLASLHRWLFRQPRTDEELLAEASLAAPGVVVLRVGRDAEGEFALLSRLGLALPDVTTLVVVEGDENQIGLAWDLGACEVLPLSRCRDELAPRVVRYFLPPEAPHASHA